MRWEGIESRLVMSISLIPFQGVIGSLRRHYHLIDLVPRSHRVIASLSMERLHRVRVVYLYSLLTRVLSYHTLVNTQLIQRLARFQRF